MSKMWNTLSVSIKQVRSIWFTNRVSVGTIYNVPVDDIDKSNYYLELQMALGSHSKIEA